jgi:hypothetical protein
MPTSHIEEDVLGRYAMGVLARESIPEVEEHLLICAFCQGRLVETDEFLICFRAAASEIYARPVPLWKRFPAARRVFWGVSGVVTAALLLLLISGEPHPAKLPPPVLLLQSLRGPEARAQVASGRPCLLVFDLPIQPARADYDIEIVDAVGKEILEAGAQVKENRLTVQVDKLARGTYWVRVYRRQPARELVAEYGLQAQ